MFIRLFGSRLTLGTKRWCLLWNIHTSVRCTHPNLVRWNIRTLCDLHSFHVISFPFVRANATTRTSYQKKTQIHWRMLWCSRLQFLHTSVTESFFLFLCPAHSRTFWGENPRRLQLFVCWVVFFRSAVNMGRLWPCSPHTNTIWWESWIHQMHVTSCMNNSVEPAD